MKLPRPARNRLTLCLALLSSPAVIGDVAVAPPVVHKARLVDQMLSDSALVKRIEAGSDVRSRALLDEARATLARARDAMAASDNAEANRELDEALRLMREARAHLNLRPEPVPQTRTQFETKLAGILSLRSALHERLTPGSATTEALLPIDLLVADSRHDADDGDLPAALRHLDEAERLLSALHVSAIGSTTVDYTLEHATPEQRYRAALARNQGFADLIPLAISELHTDSQRTAELNATLADNRVAVDEAVQAAAQDQYPGATARLNRATQVIQRSLEAAGLNLIKAARE